MQALQRSWFWHLTEKNKDVVVRLQQIFKCWMLLFGMIRLFGSGQAEGCWKDPTFSCL